MNTAQQLARMSEWLDTHPAPPTPRDASDYDEDTLRRSFAGLSRSARREQRRPRSLRPSEPWQDEVAACEIGGAR